VPFPERVKNNLSSRFSFSFKAKAIIAFFLFNAVVSAALSITAYRVLYSSMFEEIQGRAKDIAQLGGYLLDKPVIKRLIGRMSPDMTWQQVDDVEQSADFKSISDQLNILRNTESGLIRFAYILRPSENGRDARYVADADTLSDLKKRGVEQDKVKGISRFNSAVNTSHYPVFQQAVKEGKIGVEKEFYYDDVFKVYSISAYFPILDADSKKVLALLCLDIADKNVHDALRKSRNLSLIIIGVSLLLSLVISIVLGNVFSKGILALDTVVKRYGEKDFSVRCTVKSRDEIGRLGFSLNSMAETIQNYATKLESLLSAYSRFVPKKFLQFLRKESIVDVQLGDQIQQEMTILFADIRSFTTLSESMTPAENFNFINSYLKRMGPKIRHHNGFIDKYIGDGIMALFPGSPEDAVMASIDMLKALEEYNVHRRSAGYQPIRIGVGIHSGLLMLGTIGEQERMDGSVISDAVNLCSRLERLTKDYKVSIIISKDALEKLEDRDKYHIRFLDNVRVKGKKKPASIYEVYDMDPPDVVERKDMINARLESGIQLYFEGKLPDALEVFVTLQQIYPEDMLIQLYIDRCKKYMEQGLPED
jgi:class 3 adenylate cyclase